MTQGTRVIVRTRNGPPGRDGEVTQAALDTALTGALRNRGSLAFGDDLNTLVEPADAGIYRVTTAVTNEPTGAGAGTLEVLSEITAGIARPVQRYTDLNGSSWWRTGLRSSAGVVTWDPWTPVPEASTFAAGLLAAGTAAEARDVLGALAWLDYVGTGSLDEVIERGTYRQHSTAWATTAHGYPAEGHPGILEVYYLGASVRVQRFTSERPEGGMWTRRGAETNGVWSWQPWRAYLPTTVDTTAGTLVSVGGVPVRYDSGPRVLTAWDSAGNVTQGALPDGLVPAPGVSGSIEVQRHLDRIDVRVAAASSTGYVGIALPAGFRPRRSGRASAATSSGPVIAYYTATMLWLSAAVHHPTTRSHVSITDPAALPTALPGTPA